MTGAVTGTIEKYKASYGFVRKLSEFKDKATCQIVGATTEERIEALAKRFNKVAKNKQKLLYLLATAEGRQFVDQKIDTINREAFHRSAFFGNALVHAGFVNFSLLTLLPSYQLKLAFVGANLAISGFAHIQMRRELSRLVKGPQALPSKRKFFGLLKNKKYNKAVQASAKPHARQAWRERYLYRTGYFANAGLMFFGAEFLLAPDKLIPPISYVVSFATSLVTTPTAIINGWTGVKSLEASLQASMKENSTYKKYQI